LKDFSHNGHNPAANRRTVKGHNFECTNWDSKGYKGIVEAGVSPAKCFNSLARLASAVGYYRFYVIRQISKNWVRGGSGCPKAMSVDSPKAQIRGCKAAKD
jgi:hypothetical protein